MPISPAIWHASSVARFRSFDAPPVTPPSPAYSASAARPASRTQMRFSRSPRVYIVFSAGIDKLYPAAPFADGTMLTLRMRSSGVRSREITACPASCSAISRRSSSPIRMLRSPPATSVRYADSISASQIRSDRRRAARMAASFRRFSSDAPENSTVRAARSDRSTSASIGFPRA